MDQGSNKNHSPAYNFTPTVTKLCVMWEGLSLPHDTNFGNCRCKIVDSRSFHSWSLIHGLRWSGLIKVGPGCIIKAVCAFCVLLYFGANCIYAFYWGSLHWHLAPLLSNRISVIHGSRINYETICCPQFCTYSYQILCHVGGTSPPTWHKIW